MIMKFHFGHLVLLGFILFGLLIGTLVYKSLNTEFELVSRDYYKDEIAYQQVIDASKNALQLSSSPEIVQQQKHIMLTMPAEFRGENLTGIVYFYCPSDSKKDRKIAIHVNADGCQELTAKTFIPPAPYTVRISWNCMNKNYFQESNLLVQ